MAHDPCLVPLHSSGIFPIFQVQSPCGCQSGTTHLVISININAEVVQVTVMVMGEDLMVQARGGAGTRKEDGWGGEQLYIYIYILCHTHTKYIVCILRISTT
jgi:hypothetical protein